MASSDTNTKASKAPPVIVFVMAALAVLGLGLTGYFYLLDKNNRNNLSLTPEAKAYARNLKLADVEMKASESYLKQTVVEIDGKITNNGERKIETVDIFCLFYDTYRQLVLRHRVSIVSGKMGGLKPGETKTFRLPFEDLPQSWNQAMPQLVIAGVKFQ